MKKKTFIFSMIIVCFILFCSVPFIVAFAEIPDSESGTANEELNENIEELLSELDLSGLQEYLDSLKGLSGWNAKDKIKELLSGGALNYPNVFSALFSVFTDSVADMLPSFAAICAICLLCGILNGIKGSFLKDSTGEIIFFVCYISVLVILLSQLANVFSLCSTTMSGLKKQMEIIFPILLTLMAASGGTVSAGVYRPAAAFLCDGIADILTEAVIPFTVIIIVLNMVEKLNKNVKLRGFTSFFKSLNKWLIGVGVTVFGIFLTTQGLTAAAYDGISIRAAKYAISNSIPIVGNFLSGGFDLVLAGNALIKNSVGMIGVFLILTVAVQPTLTIIAFTLFLRFTAAICEPVGDERISGFLTKLAEAMNYAIAALASLAFLYFLTILLLICSAGVIF